MKKYIPLDALVAEIEKLENKLYYEPENFKDVGAKMALDSLKSFLDTIEVKKVDLYEDADNYCGTLTSDIRGNIYLNDFYKIAEHFFELGMAVNNKAQKGE